jgi:tetratricopeptide (TPR) repeat protein
MGDHRSILNGFLFSLAMLTLGGLSVAAPAANAKHSAPQQQATTPPAQTSAPAAQPQPTLNPQSNGKPEPPPVSKEEEDDYQAFASLKPQQADLIVSQGQAFLRKYALSSYRPNVYSRLAIIYLNTNQLDKLVSTGQLALNEDPDNLPVLALMAATLPRTQPQGLDASQRLDLAERYARRAIRLSATLTRPSGLTEEQFERAKDEQLAMAHTGLGLVSYRRGDTAGSVSELDQATKLDPTPDPIDFYLLGDGEMKLKKFTEAAAAFDRCARAQWDSQWQARCRDGEAAAQKASTAKPSAGPKP